MGKIPVLLVFDRLIDTKHAWHGKGMAAFETRAPKDGIFFVIIITPRKANGKGRICIIVK